MTDFLLGAIAGVVAVHVAIFALVVLLLCDDETPETDQGTVQWRRNQDTIGPH